MLKLIDGKAIAERLKDKIAADIFALNGPRPSLAIILVGEREDSRLYVSLKEKEGLKVGIDTHVYRLEEDISEGGLLEVIKFLNNDPAVDGILVQLPLPPNLDTEKITGAIDPSKDVDGFHPQRPEYITSPVLAAVGASLDEISLSGEGKVACVIYNSEIFGYSLKAALEKRGFQVLMKDRPEEADLVVTALGEPHSLKAAMVKEGATIIDIGIAKEDGAVLGDADRDDLKDKPAYITPVPGGIGPMTIAFLFQNVWEIFKRRLNER